MTRSVRIAALAAAAASAALAPPADAGRGYGIRALVSSYSTFKVGAYSPTATGAGDGLYLGAEFGVVTAPQLEFGLTADYMYRGSSRGGSTIQIDTSYDIPVEEVIDASSSNTHLGMLGAVARLRFTPKGSGFSPYVSGGVLLQLLHLNATTHFEDGPFSGSVSESDTFAGIGYQLGGGLDIALSPSTALVTEAGYVWAEPTKKVDVDYYDTSATFRAKASGVMVRGGFRVRY